MKKTKLLVLIGAVLLISLMSVSGAWAGFANTTLPGYVTGGGATFDTVFPQDLEDMGTSNAGMTHYGGQQGVVGPGETVTVCFDLPDTVTPAQQAGYNIFYFDSGSWIQLTTTGTNPRCAEYTNSSDASAFTTWSFQAPPPG